MFLSFFVLEKMTRFFSSLDVTLPINIFLKGAMLILKSEKIYDI